MKILGEDEKDILQFASAHPWASIGRLITAERSRIAEDVLTRAVEKGLGTTLSLAPDSTLSRCGILMAHSGAWQPKSGFALAYFRASR